MDIRKHAVPETAVFHLRDAAEVLMYEQKKAVIDGVETEVNDLDKPVRVHLYSPGSKQFAQAQSDRNNRILARMQAKGTADRPRSRSRKRLPTWPTAPTRGRTWTTRASRGAT
jgi:hypothetical protein